MSAWLIASQTRQPLAVDAVKQRRAEKTAAALELPEAAATEVFLLPSLARMCVNEMVRRLPPAATHRLPHRRFISAFPWRRERSAYDGDVAPPPCARSAGATLAIGGCFGSCGGACAQPAAASSTA